MFNQPYQCQIHHCESPVAVRIASREDHREHAVRDALSQSSRQQSSQRHTSLASKTRFLPVRLNAGIE